MGWGGEGGPSSAAPYMPNISDLLFPPCRGSDRLCLISRFASEERTASHLSSHGSFRKSGTLI